MCQMRVIVLREMLGNREICWSLWDGKQTMEMTSNQIKNIINKGNKVCGLKIGTSGELERDVEGFYCTNIMEHRHSSNYVPMVDEAMASLFYICIGSHVENGQKLYDCISTRWERLSLDEASLRAYLKIGIVSAGVTEIDGKLVVADLEFKKQPEQVAEQNEVVVEDSKGLEVTTAVKSEPTVEPVVEVESKDESTEQEKGKHVRESFSEKYEKLSAKVSFENDIAEAEKEDVISVEEKKTGVDTKTVEKAGVNKKKK